MSSFELDAETRIARRHAQWVHALQALEVFEARGEPREAMELALEMQLLRPYWNRPGVTKEQAAAAFDEDPQNGGRALASAMAMLTWAVKCHEVFIAAVAAAPERRRETEA
jgi:hypothetical protein